MGKRGPKPAGKVKIKWSADFAYAIGLIVADGCLSGDGRHVCLVSKDVEQLKNFSKALGLRSKIGRHVSGLRKYAYRVQFGDVLFYQFLLTIGLAPAKSKTLGPIIVPNKYFLHYLRGVFDGDGYSYSYWDRRWKSSFMFYVAFCSASSRHLAWLQEKIKDRLGIVGHITKSKKSSCLQLKYSKREACQLVSKMYPRGKLLCLTRKRLKISKALAIVNKQ